MVGLVFDVQRFCTHDGPGIRTTVFLKGCPLDCIWCHNPESKRSVKELLYTPGLCIACGKCAAACKAGAHVLANGTHEFQRARCCACMTCAEACYSRALEVAGREVSVEETLAEVVRDRPFYEESGGGMTLSGGEPMAQFEFTCELLKGAKASGIHTCVETCGLAPTEQFLEAAPSVDLFLWDIKDTNPERHKSNTGAPLEPIVRNLEAIDRAGAATILRCILVAGVNMTDAHLDGIALVYARLANCLGVELLAYHAMGTSKCERLGIPSQLDSSAVPTPEHMSAAREYLRERGVPVL